MKMLKSVSSIPLSWSWPSFFFFHVLISHLQRLTLAAIRNMHKGAGLRVGGSGVKNIRVAFGLVGRICR